MILLITIHDGGVEAAPWRLRALLWRSHQCRPQGHGALLTPASFQGLDAAQDSRVPAHMPVPLSQTAAPSRALRHPTSSHCHLKDIANFLPREGQPSAEQSSGKVLPPQPQLALRGTTLCTCYSPKHSPSSQTGLTTSREGLSLPFVCLRPLLATLPFCPS